MSSLEGKPPLGTIDIQTFLDQYWQKKPCLIRNAFADMEPELDTNDVAGLACEELAESRLISGRFEQQNWTQQYGPFSEKELRELPEENWTLLVQDVEKHYPPLQSLLEQFRFIPSWRMDDLMISIAAPGGSVGPHVDQYDVFLLQASGHRRWQIATKFDASLLDDCDLNVLKAFTPEQEWDLGPGDMLYLPPGVAHHGVALDTCMTWSIGMRAPSQADLLQALGEYLAETCQEGSRYQDVPLTSLPRPGEISVEAITGLKNLLIESVQGKERFNGFLAQFLTRYRMAHQPAAPDELFSQTDLQAGFSASMAVLRNPWTCLAWIEENGAARLFASGDEYRCSLTAALKLCDSQGAISLDDFHQQEDSGLLLDLINAGHFYVGYVD